MQISAQLKTLPKRYINKILNDTTDISKPQFMMYPVVAYAPETSVELGFSGLYVRYAKGDTTNRLSEINAFVFYTLQNQFGGFFEHAIYSDKNEWFFLGKLKFQSFPLSYYGIGPDAPDVKLARVDAFQVQIKERILRKVYKSFYGGLEFDMQHLGNVNFKDYDTNTTYTKPLGNEGSTNFGLGAGILFDDRHNVLNVRKGIFAELAFIHYDQKFGSQFTFTSIFSDFRYFHPVRKRNVLAFQYLGQYTLGNPPFNQMALMGGEMMMRGYYTGRYRDRNLMAFQTEYRMLPFKFAKRFGASIFASTGVVSHTLSDIKRSHLVYSGGAGIRFLLFPKKDIWTRLDFAVTEEGHGFYLFIGEAF
ncbi:MAG: BamA/TamA family outer membrane protein [Flavobacteriia bacterium]